MHLGSRTVDPALIGMRSTPSPLLFPPAHAWRFFSDDVDEVREAIGRMHGEHSRVPHGRGPYGFDFRAVGTPDARAAFAWARVGQPQTIRGDVRRPVVHVAVDRPMVYTFGRRKVETRPGDIVFLAGGTEFSRRSEAGTMVGVQFDAAALAAEVTARQPARGCVSALTSRRLTLAAGAARALTEAGAGLAAIGVPPHQQALREADVLTALAQALCDQTDLARAHLLTTHRLADLETWIEAHLADPLTLGCLCAAAGVGERALQIAFHARHGMSPMRFVAERRLAAAHRRLACGGPGDTVTDIAIGAGFSHLGRFSTLYRQAYGETPSQTLQRRRSAP